MKKNIIVFWACLLSILLHPLPICASVYTDPTFQKAQQLYSDENYEEALETLKSVRSKYPGSSEIAFYLGMTYKHMQDYNAAQPLLEEACRLKPRYDNAMPELIELLYQKDLLNEAKEWIGVAEREFIAPAQIAFLKGLVLLKLGQEDSAIKAFNDAESLEPSLAQSAAYQKALALSQQKDYTHAQEQLRSIVIKDPTSDLAAFANEYLDALRRQQEMDRTMKGNISYSLQYDDNVIFKPTDSSLSSDISEKADWLHVVTAQTELALLKPTRNELLGLNAVYSFYGTKHNDLGFYNTMSHDISLQPSYYAGTTTWALPIHYNYVTLNEHRYLDTAGLSAVLNLADASDTLWQIQLQYNLNDFHWLATDDDENRDNQEITLSTGHYWFWDASGYLNINYAANYSAAKGNNWKYYGNRITLTLVKPLVKTLQWNFVTDLFRQDFLKTNSTYIQRRKNNAITVSNLLVKEISKNLELQAQHTFAYDISTIKVYKYKKNTYNVGMKYRF